MPSLVPLPRLSANGESRHPGAKQPMHDGARPGEERLTQAPVAGLLPPMDDSNTPSQPATTKPGSDEPGFDEAAPGRRKATRRIIVLVALINGAFFFVEAAIALRIGSVSLFADSVDFLEDASINLLILLALGLGVLWRRRVALLLAAIILVPGLAALWTAVGKIMNPSAPDALVLTLTGLAAFAVNGLCVLLLKGVRDGGGALTLAAFLSARNDLVSNAAIIAAGIATGLTGSMLPDLVVGLLIVWINADAAWDVYQAAKRDGVSGRAPEP